ncbi:MAG: DUF1207 domain-containing protein [Gemmatimonadota bacterium]
MRIRAIAVLFAALFAPASGFAQTGWFPEHRAFPGPVADPLEPRIAGGLVVSDLFEVRAAAPAERPPFRVDADEPADDLESDLQATVALGGTMPLWGTRTSWNGNIIIAPQLAVFARFRIEPASRDVVGTDWIAALPLEVRFNDRVEARLRVLHRSAHLGDELLQSAGALRLEFSHEAVDALVGVRPIPGLRVYGGGALVIRSQTFRWADRGDGLFQGVVDFDDDFWAQGGVEAEGGGAWGWHVAADWQAAQRSDWKEQISAIAGVTARFHGRHARLHLRYQTGVSPLGEFFLTDERVVGVELEFEP